VERQTVSGWCTVERAEVYHRWNWVRGEGEREERERVERWYWGSGGATVGVSGGFGWGRCSKGVVR